VTTEVIPFNRCRIQLENVATLEEDLVICSGANGLAACSGDSGGPLVDAETGIVVGITSFRSDCDKFPTIFGRTSKVADWIQQTVCDVSNNPPPSCWPDFKAMAPLVPALSPSNMSPSNIVEAPIPVPAPIRPPIFNLISELNPTVIPPPFESRPPARIIRVPKGTLALSASTLCSGPFQTVFPLETSLVGFPLPNLALHPMGAPIKG